MWPIYFVLAWYASIFLFLATAAYVCISVVAGLNQLGKRIFLAILAFGGSALLGYILANLVSYLHTGINATAEPNRYIVAIAYFIPGLVGAWYSWRTFKPST